MPLLQWQWCSGLSCSTSSATWHSLFSSMAPRSRPTRHWRMMRNRELHWALWLHISLARRQSIGAVQPASSRPTTTSSGSKRGEANVPHWPKDHLKKCFMIKSIRTTGKTSGYFYNSKMEIIFANCLGKVFSSSSISANVNAFASQSPFVFFLLKNL